MTDRIEEIRAASDAEVNLIVAKLIYPGCEIEIFTSHGSGEVTGRFVRHGDFTFPLPQYCQGWSDAGPLMIDNRISVLCHRDEFCAYSFGQDHMSKHKNPLRAIAETFIIMKWSEEDEI